MKFQMSALKFATILTAAGAALWIGSAVAAPLPSTYPPATPNLGSRQDCVAKTR